MDLIKILNMMREENIPDTFEEFKKQYLTDTNKFTDDGAVKYLDNIAGYISYLNREKDVRQFAYPVFYEVKTLMSKQPGNDMNRLKDQLFKVSNSQIEMKDIKLKGKSKEDKAIIKAKIEVLKEEKKKLKKIIKEGQAKLEDDISQETAIDKCLK